MVFTDSLASNGSWLSESSIIKVLYQNNFRLASTELINFNIANPLSKNDFPYKGNPDEAFINLNWGFDFNAKQITNYLKKILSSLSKISEDANDSISLTDLYHFE